MRLIRSACVSYATHAPHTLERQVDQMKAMGIHAAMVSASSSKQVSLSVLPYIRTRTNAYATMRPIRFWKRLIRSRKQDVAHLHDVLVDDRGAAPDAAKGPLKLAHVTPERIIKSKVFLARLERAHALGRIAAFVVDEAHCCRYSVCWLY